ncbi:hypothetical protein PSP6_160030 [Paraburkholderia tropica]|nr:hypothetical protein PSP6_160030 [Paraburkholderia tropica]
MLFERRIGIGARGWQSGCKRAGTRIGTGIGVKTAKTRLRSGFCPLRYSDSDSPRPGVRHVRHQAAFPTRPARSARRSARGNLPRQRPDFHRPAAREARARRQGQKARQPAPSRQALTLTLTRQRQKGGAPEAPAFDPFADSRLPKRPLSKRSGRVHQCTGKPPST